MTKLKTDTRYLSKACSMLSSKASTPEQRSKAARFIAIRRRKLNDQEVYEIKLCIYFGFSDSDLSKMYNVTQQTINSIRQGRTWKYVKLKKEYANVEQYKSY